jgi:hypothetical protein
VGTDLDGSATQGIGSLIGVTALDPFATVLAGAHLDIKTGGDRLDRWQVGLILGDDLDLMETTAAVGTHSGGQGRGFDPINLVGNQPM